MSNKKQGNKPTAPKKGEPTKQPGTAVSTQKVDTKAMILMGDKHDAADLAHLQNTQGRGNENVGVEDLVVPRLIVLQALSPELEQGNAKYIAGAKAGDLVNSVTGKVYGSKVYIVPVDYSKQWLVWRDRKQGGGFFGAFPDQIAAQARADEEGGKEKGVEVMDTPTHLCLLVDFDSNSIDEIILSMPRTKAKVSRQWNSMIRLAGGDRFSKVYAVSTALEKNKRQEAYHNFVIASSGMPAKPLYQRAEKLYMQVKSGGRTIKMDTSDLNAGGDPQGDGNTDPESEM